MTNADVERTIGAKPYWHDGVIGFQGGYPGGWAGRWPRGHFRYVPWVGLNGVIFVEFDEAERVVGATFHDYKPVRWSPMDFAFERLVLRFLKWCDWCWRAHVW